VTEPDYSVVLFPSTSGAIRAEKLTKEAGLRIKLIPVPRQLSSDCGVCLRCESTDAQAVCCLLERANVEFERIAGL
jgi:hypothetical protein